MTDNTDFDFTRTYKREGFEGIAWRAYGYVMERDEDYDWSGIETPNHDWVIASMIGDDVEFHVEVVTLTAIEDDDYCSGCGQIGCTHDGR
jgi:hypothetical protein